MAQVVRSVSLPHGIRLPYVEHGDPAGLPVVFLHGYTDSWRSYQTVLPNLPRYMRAFALSQRVYPIPLEWGRLARIGVAGTAAYAAAWSLPAMSPLVATLVRGSVVTLAFPACLAALGFLDARELRTLGRVLERVRAGRTGAAAETPAAAATDVALADDQQIP